MDESRKHERFLHLFLPVQPQLNGYLRTLIPNRADAEDILQEAAAVMWDKFDDFRPGTRFDRWARRVAHLQAMAYFEKRKRNKLVFGEEVVVLLANTAASVSERASEMKDTLDFCVALLPEKDRKLLRLRFEQGATNRSVASALGRSESTVSRALSHLYGELLACIERRATSESQGGSQ